MGFVSFCSHFNSFENKTHVSCTGHLLRFPFLHALPSLAAARGRHPTHAPSLGLSPCPCLSASHFLLVDELYAQKLKYKAISEELDHALNDMTSM